MGIFSTILDLIFPTYCLSCHKRGFDICIDCLSLARGAQRESESWIFPIFDYRDKTIKKAIHLLKYKHKKNVAKVMAEHMLPRILEELGDRKLMENFIDPILIPIPLAGKRKRERGFNQAELLCIEIIGLDTKNNLKTLKNVLLKPKDTVHQAHIKERSARLKNLKGSFVVRDPLLVKGRNIILIDDVTTTGATLSEARKTLKEAGARKVIAFTVAH